MGHDPRVKSETMQARQERSLLAEDRASDAPDIPDKRRAKVDEFDCIKRGYDGQAPSSIRNLCTTKFETRARITFGSCHPIQQQATSLMLRLSRIVSSTSAEASYRAKAL